MGSCGQGGTQAHGTFIHTAVILRKAQYMAGHHYTNSTESYLQNKMQGLEEEVSNTIRYKLKLDKNKMM